MKEMSYKKWSLLHEMGLDPIRRLRYAALHDAQGVSCPAYQQSYTPFRAGYEVYS